MGVGWVDLWLSQEVRLDDGGEVNLPSPWFEETTSFPLLFFSIESPAIDFVSRKRSTLCRKRDPQGHVPPRHDSSRNRRRVMGMGAINGDDTRTVAETARSNSRWNKVSIKSPFFSTILWPVRWKIGVFLPWCGWSIDAAVARRIGCFSGAVDGTIRTCLVERKKLIYRGEGNQFDSFSC